MTDSFLSPFGDNRATRTARLVLRALPGSTVMPILSGPMRGQRWIVGAGVHSCWIGVYERRKQAELTRVLRPGTCFLDVGAHAGLYTLLAARLVGPAGSVVAIEPLPSNMRILRRHLELNRLHNVTVIEAAAGAQTGPGRFTSGDSSYTGRFGDGELMVVVETLDHLFLNRRIPTPTLVKIDVEGAEVDVLRGGQRLLKEARPVVLLATHGEGPREASLSLLRDLGYRVRDLGTQDEWLAEAPAA